jgi:hypothetical protein
MVGPQNLATGVEPTSFQPKYHKEPFRTEVSMKQEIINLALKPCFNKDG